MLTYDTIAREIKEGKLRPAYLLSGDEPYFIDKLTELFLRSEEHTSELQSQR